MSCHSLRNMSVRSHNRGSMEAGWEQAELGLGFVPIKMRRSWLPNSRPNTEEIVRPIL
jgi:hypothetical protein